METQFTDQDVSNFLKQIIELGGCHIVDESPDKYIRLASSKKQEVLTVDGASKPLAIYGTKAVDAIIINPFAEGDADSTRNAWFYASRNRILSMSLIAIMQHLLQIGAEARKKNKHKGETEEPTDLTAIRLLGSFALDVDEKMLKEFKNISADASKFFVVHYNKTARQSEVSCVLYTEAQRKSFGNSIRVKTWDVLRGIMNAVLDTDDLSVFTTVPNTLGFPVFESYTKTLIKVYEAIREPLTMLGREPEQLETLNSHLRYLDQYAAKAKWCTSVTTTPIAPMPTPQGTPWQSPMPVGVPGMAPIPGMMPQVPMGMPGTVPMAPQPVMPPMGTMPPMQQMAPMGMVPMNTMAPMGGMMPPIPMGGMPQPYSASPMQNAGKSRNPFERP